MDSRESWVASIINTGSFERIAEIGVYEGEFTRFILKNCKSIKKYYGIDPWTKLSDWNKPLNKTKVLASAKEKAYSIKDERLQLIEKLTVDVKDEIEDNSLDLVYIDGDHTLRGITIDLDWAWRKTKDTGIIIGDDFNKNILHHGIKYEPTLVCPYAVFFAEAKNVSISARADRQFIINKNWPYDHKFNILHSDILNLRNQFSWKNQIKARIISLLHSL